MNEIKKGSIDQTLYFKILDAVAGTPKTGLNPGALDATYVRTRSAAVKADCTTLASVDGAHSDNAAIQVDITNAPGLYRVDFPDAAWSTGAAQVVCVINCVSCDPAMQEISLVDNINGELKDSAIAAATFAPAAINASAIAANAITSTKFAAGAINASAVAADTITASAIAADAITAAKLAANAITSAKFAAGAINASAIAADAITSSAIAANAITPGKFLVGAINASAIAADAITSSAIAANAITAAKFAVGAINASAVAADAINSSAIAAGAITAAKFAAGAINAAAIAADALTSAKFAAGAVNASALAADAVTEIWTTGLTEAYAADGATFTGAQALYMIWAFLAEKAVTTTTLTANKLDGATAAMTFSLDSAASPTAITRAT